jgi:ABC-2 type transport system permease protein
LNSEYEKLKIVSRYELLKQLRRKRFYGAVIITILAQILAIVLYKGLDIPGTLAKNNPEIAAILQDTPKLFAWFITSLGSALPILFAVFFAGDSIASEFENRTGYLLFPNPVKRRTIVIGKYIACFIATTVVMILAYVVAVTALLGFYRQLPIEVWSSLGLSIVLACSVLSIAFLFSSLLKGGMGATIGTLLTYLLIFPIVSSSLSTAGHKPWFMLDFAGNSRASIYNFPLSFGGRVGGMTLAEPGVSLLVMLAYFVFPLLLSVWITQRKEMI